MRETLNTIAIVGGGIGGLTMALTLKRNNQKFKLFEKSNEFKEIGAGIGIASNALEIFDKLNIGIEIRKRGHLLKRTILATEKLKVLKTIPFPKEVYCIHRSLIIDTISNELDKNSYELNKEVDSIENKKRIKVKFKDETIEEFKTLIASDGINSTIRKSVFPEIGIRNAHQVIWRGITKFDINANLKHTYYELFEGTLRFLFLPLNDTEIFWLAVQKKKKFKKHSSISLKSYLLKIYRNFNPIVLDILSRTSECDILQNELGDIKPYYKSWFKNNIVFIGDSIHATTPNLGQGACQAIEDAYTLGLCIKNNTDGAFIHYQNIRLKKVKYIVEQSWIIGKISLTTGRLQKKILHIFMKLFPVKQYQKRFNRIIDIKYLNELENTDAKSINKK